MLLGPVVYIKWPGRRARTHRAAARNGHPACFATRSPRHRHVSSVGAWTAISGHSTLRLRAHLPTRALPGASPTGMGGDTARRRLSALTVQGLPRPRRKWIIGLPPAGSPVL